MEPRRVRVAVLRTEPELPSARVRWRELAPELDGHGVTVELLRIAKRETPDDATLAALRAADVVVVHRELPRRPERAWLRALGRPLVFDFDDAVMAREVKKHGSHASLRRRLRFGAALRFFDAFTCGSAWLAARCRTSKPVLVAPSPVPIDVPVRDHATPNEPPRVGWVGLGGNLPYLRALAPALRRVAERHAFALVVVSNAPFELEGLPAESVPWSLDAQRAELGRFDVGLMPIEDTLWGRGKCAYKALQYMASGVPPIASRVGANLEAIEDGVSGFLVTNDAGWEEALVRLLSSATLRAQVGRAARARAVARYSRERCATDLAAFLRSLARSPAGARADASPEGASPDA